MPPDELLRRYPRETLRWLRGRLGADQVAFARQLGVGWETVVGWESRRQGIGRANRDRLAALIAPHLATPEGEAFTIARRESEGEG